MDVGQVAGWSEWSAFPCSSGFRAWNLVMFTIVFMMDEVLR